MICAAFPDREKFSTIYKKCQIFAVCVAMSTVNMNGNGPHLRENCALYANLHNVCYRNPSLPLSRESSLNFVLNFRGGGRHLRPSLPLTASALPTLTSQLLSVHPPPCPFLSPLSLSLPIPPLLAPLFSCSPVAPRSLPVYPFAILTPLPSLHHAPPDLPPLP